MSDGAALPRRGAICTFYSFKGGVGRSMTLANVATLMARWNRRVLIVDWDLEAPGLEQFFDGYLINSRKSTPGLVDLFAAFGRGERLDWRDCLLHATPKVADPIDILHAGLDDDLYIDRLRSIAWDGPAESGLGNYLEELRAEWKRSYDFILIDSRTGITDVGGICAVHLPDILVVLFTTTRQSLKGLADVLARTEAARQRMKVDRTRLLMLPIPARDEGNTEYELAKKWRGDFARVLARFPSDWLPKNVDTDQAFSLLRVPYVAFWSFGETLPVLSEDAENPKTLAYSFTLIARLLNSRLDWGELRTGAQAAGAEAEQQVRLDVQSAEAARKREEAQLLAQQREQRAEEAKRERLMTMQAAIESRADSIHRWLTAQRGSAQVTWWLAMVASLFAGGMAFAYFVAPRFRAWADQSMGSEWSGPTSQAPIFLVGMVVTFAAGGIGALTWLRSGRARRRLDRLRRETAALRGRVAAYRELPDQDAWALFAERIEVIAAEPEEDAQPAVLSLAAPAPQLAISELSATLASTAAQAVAAPVPGRTYGSSPLPDEIDVLLAHGGPGLAGAWVREFVPLLTLWLGEVLGRAPVVHDASADGSPNSGMFGSPRGRDALQRSRCAVVVITRRFTASPSTQDDLDALTQRFGPEAVFAVLLDRDALATANPGSSRGMTTVDFSAYSFIGEGFSKSDRYVAFQQAVQALALGMAAALQEEVRPAA